LSRMSPGGFAYGRCALEGGGKHEEMDGGPGTVRGVPRKMTYSEKCRKNLVPGASAKARNSARSWGKKAELRGERGKKIKSPGGLTK